MKRLFRYLMLPKEVTPFEDRYLRRVNRIALFFFWGHLPIFMLIAGVNEMSVLGAGLLTAVVLAGPTLAYRVLKPRTVPLVYGVASMCLGGLLVHFGQGIVQIEMHFYF